MKCMPRPTKCQPTAGFGSTYWHSGSGMTTPRTLCELDATRAEGRDSRLRGNDVGGFRGNDAGGCGSSRVRARVFVACCRTVLHCVGFCRLRIWHRLLRCAALGSGMTGEGLGRGWTRLAVRMFRAWGCLLGVWFRDSGHRPRVVREFCFVKYGSVGSMCLRR